MLTRRLLFVFAVLLVAAGCQDATMPTAEPDWADPEFHRWWGTGDASPTTKDVMLLRQSPSAPPLETYQASFTARRWRASSFEVRYVATDGESRGPLFLRFDVPEMALVGGGPVAKDGTVEISVTIDPVTFFVDFQPTGLQFSRRFPPTLTMCYGNADPDLNGDGVVDEADRLLEARLAVWYRTSTTGTRWLKTSSKHDLVEKCISAPIQHFSGYAVSW